MNYLPPVNSSDPFYAWRKSLYSMFKTLGMDSSSAEPTDSMGTGFEWTGDAYKEYPKNISDCAYKFGPSGGINSNAVDFNKYMGFWLDSARTNSSFNNILQVHNNHESSESLGKYGLGGNVYTYKGSKYFSKGGNTATHTSVFCAFPDEQVAAVLFINTDFLAVKDWFCQDIADKFTQKEGISINGFRNLSSEMLNMRDQFIKDNEEMKANSTNTTTLPLESYIGLIPTVDSSGDKLNISILTMNSPVLQTVRVQRNAPTHPAYLPLATYQYVPFGNNSFANIVNGKLWPAISTIFFPMNGSVVSNGSKFNPL